MTGEGFEALRAAVTIAKATQVKNAEDLKSMVINMGLLAAAT